MRKLAYIYPVFSIKGDIVPNAYIDHFTEALGNCFDFVNIVKPSNKGILDIIYYLNKIQYIFLNWIEDLPDKRGGVLQSVFFIFIVFLFKIMKIKVIWIMHNQESHYETNVLLKRILYAFILKHSDFIITHARKGIDCFNKFNIKNKEKIKYLPHPLNQDFILYKEHPTIDMLIWGTIIPYKGVDQFLKFLHDQQLERKYRILIAGKVKSVDYLKVINQYCNESIQLDNRYIPENELKQIMADSRVVVFTYKSDSLLSTGALMDTLSYGAKILAPHIGAFKDIQEEGLIDTYHNFNELIKLFDGILGSELIRDQLAILNFINEHNWEKFSLKICNWII